MIFFSKFVFASLFALCFTTCYELAFEITQLPDGEVKALREIAKTLGKNWNFSVDPCGGLSGWNTTKNKDFMDEVKCDYTITSDGIPHVVSINLKRQNLSGTLPPELVKLPYLQTIDLTRNYLNGTLPREWSSMKHLLKISLLGNRISDSIPKEYGSISNLTTLVLEFNQLSGSIPPELGNLKNLEILHLTSNYLSGDLPKTLANLTSLKELLISDNNFSGNIPNYIQNWPNLQRLFMQASGLNGPIPSSIASLVNMSELRISDMKGIQQRFPPLEKMANLKYLILRSCNINDTLPDYLTKMSPENLKVFDLSFNNLHGTIPERYTSLKKMDYFYLTGNLLTGVVPEGMSAKSDYIDLSYNNFTVGSSESCQQGNMNVFETSLLANNSGDVSCFKTPICPNRLSHEFHINCGGDRITIGNTTYEADTNPGGPSNIFKSATNWAFSNTGHFMDVKENDYITKSESMNNSQLIYNTARLSPLSLTYYGFCLQNGNYTVKLHFAEIVFSDNKTYNSLGRRFFDIYIQGRLVKKDFNIAAEANGVNKPIVREFTANVTNNSLNIRLYWAGKGTNAIPYKGVYGVLISAISAYDENYKPENRTHVLTIVEISAAVGVFMILVILSIFLWKRSIRQRNIITEDLKGLDQQTGTFTLRQIKAATNNFNAANKIGEGGFGPVYKGLLSDGTVIAVKQLSSKSNQGNREFVNEIGMISALQNPYLVKLYGCCIEGNQLLLVYEYLENNSLARALFGPEEHQLKLEWPTRHKICVGIAKGLAYLHEESRLKIVHRDIKATNVLLDKHLNAKISDFGLAKLDDEDNTHISTRIAGTYGYMAPEYALKGYLTDKVDVYSFGIVVLEIVSGRSNVSRRTEGGCFNLLDWVLVLKERDCLMELVDPRLGPDLNMKDMMDMVNLALLCINITPTMRPNMSTVVSMLEGKCPIPDPVSDYSSYSNDIAMKLREMRKHFEVNEEPSNNSGSNFFHNESTATGAPSTTSSSSVADLYPIKLDSYYWQKRD